MYVAGVLHMTTLRREILTKHEKSSMHKTAIVLLWEHVRISYIRIYVRIYSEVYNMVYVHHNTASST